MFTEDQYQRYWDKFTTFHKGIDLDRFDPDVVEPTIDIDDGLCVGTAASLTPRKGLEYFVEAMPHVLDDRDDVAFFIAGEAPGGHEEYERELRERVEELGVENSVRFLGWVEDMTGYLAGLDVFVLPSLNEGIPGAVREALAMEVPVVATDVGGTSDVVRNEETGTLVSPEDSEAIARGLTDLLSDPDARGEAGKRGRKLIKTEFSITGYVEQYETFITSLSQEGNT